MNGGKQGSLTEPRLINRGRSPTSRQARTFPYLGKTCPMLAPPPTRLARGTVRHRRTRRKKLRQQVRQSSDDKTGRQKYRQQVAASAKSGPLRWRRIADNEFS